MAYRVKHLPHVPIAARDGTVLSCGVLLPDAPGDGPFPVVLDAVPYRKDDDFLGLFFDTYAYLAERGFACVQLDIRGSGSSEGVLRGEYLEQEQDDACDVIAALAEHDWCNGRVGMTGVSWGGFAAMQTAARQPQALAAIVPIHFTHDRYAFDCHYVGGTLHCEEAVHWPGEMVVEMAMPPHRRLVGAHAFERVWRERLDSTPQWTLDWLSHQTRDAFWKHGSPCEDWGAIRCPTLAIGGWGDGYVDACLEVLRHVTAPRRAVIGPWTHTRPHVGWPAPAVDHRELMARWFARWLRDERNGVEDEPDLIAYLQEIPPAVHPERLAGRWRAWRRWPAADQPVRTSAAPTGAWAGPWWVGHSMPWWCGAGPPGGFTADMRPDDAASLCLDSEPLADDVAVLGAAAVRLRVSADAPVALVAARLSEVHPDGWSALVTHGVLNLTRRSSMEHPEPLVPGVAYEVEVPLMATGTVFRRGNRIRLALAGADWPNAWAPPAPFALTVHAGSLELPLAPPGDEDVELPAPGALATPSPVRPPDPGDPRPREEWVTERDHHARVTRVRYAGGWAGRYPDGRGIGTEEVVCEIADDDPTTCSATSRNTQTIEHDGLEASAVSRLAVRCDASSFHVEIALAVERDGERIMERSWNESFPRALM